MIWEKPENPSALKPNCWQCQPKIVFREFSENLWGKQVHSGMNSGILKEEIKKGSMEMTWKKFMAMPFKKKMEHIWEYYRWHILVTLVVVFALGTWIHQAVSQKDPIMQVEMVNAYGASSGSEAFQEFLSQQGRDYYEDAVLI